ncbi:hypothetical protein OROMI_011180 [Orobanche minor]
MGGKFSDAAWSLEMATNDAPALHEKCCSWGHCVSKNYAGTVNVAALVINVVAIISSAASYKKHHMEELDYTGILNLDTNQRGQRQPSVCLRCQIFILGVQSFEAELTHLPRLVPEVMKFREMVSGHELFAALILPFTICLRTYLFGLTELLSPRVIEGYYNSSSAYKKFHTFHETAGGYRLGENHLPARTFQLCWLNKHETRLRRVLIFLGKYRGLTDYGISWIAGEA